MKNIGGLNQFSAAANLTLIQHLLEKKIKNQIYSYILFIGHLEHGQCKQQQQKTKTSTFEK